MAINKTISKPEIIIKKNQLDDFVDGLPDRGPFGEELIFNKQRSIIFNRVVPSDGLAEKSESHDNYVDIFLVQEGQEEFFVGGEIINKEEVSEGEWRGSGLANARKYKISAGDIMVVPKGVPHQHGQGIVKIIIIKTA